MQKKKKNTLRHIRHRLVIILPALFIILIALLIANTHMNRSQVTDPKDLSTDISLSEDLTDASFDDTDKAPVIDDTDYISQTPVDTHVDTHMQDTPKEPEADSSPVTLLFTGDVLLSDYVLDNYNRSGIDGVLSPELLSELRDADITVINHEFPFSTRGVQAPDKQFTFRVDPKYVSALTDMGVDIAGLANNHVLDYGPDALADTFATLDHAGIEYMGAGDDLARASALITKEVGGKTFGFLAASRVIPVVSWDAQNASPGVFTTYDPTRLVEAVKTARGSCDFLTVFVHWGIEREEYPQDYQVTMAQQYIDAGADLVIGSHPHVLQGVTYYKDKPVFYSLGNFIFNQNIPKTAVVKVTIDGDKAPVIQLIAAAASGAKTSVCESSQKTIVFDYLENISTGISIDENGILSKTTD